MATPLPSYEHLGLGGLADTDNPGQFLIPHSFELRYRLYAVTERETATRT